MVEQNPNTHMLHSFHLNTSSWSVFNKYHEAPLQHIEKKVEFLKAVIRILNSTQHHK